MRVFCVYLLLFFVVGFSETEFSSFETTVIPAKYIEKLSVYLKVETIELGIIAKKGSPYAIHNFCGYESGMITYGCFLTSGVIYISEDYIHNCNAWVHEIIHAYLFKTIATPVSNHKHELFNQVRNICKS